MIKAIIFDFFGVIANDGWLPFKSKYFGHDEIMRQKATLLNRRSDAGLESYDDFISKIADLASLSEAETRKEIENNPANVRLIDYIQVRLNGRYKLGLLSNASADWLDRIIGHNAAGLFDKKCLSFETGHLKPDPYAYRDILEKLEVQPNESIFIDDQPRCVEGASAVGIHSLHYLDFDSMRTELETLLADSNN